MSLTSDPPLRDARDADMTALVFALGAIGLAAARTPRRDLANG